MGGSGGTGDSGVMIEIRDLRIGFDGVEVLRGINLEVRRGETLCVLGGSGCGKSVMLKCISGLYAPSSGDILIDGVSISGMKERDLVDVRKKIGFVFQNAALFDSLNVFDNVAYPVREHHELGEAKIADVVRERLALVGMDGTEEKFPAELSGGMRKRVALARAVSTDPAIVLYDEPTTGLDPMNARRVDLLIRELQTRLGITGIVVTHDISSAFTVADRLALMAEGVIQFQGTPEAFCASLEPLVQEFMSARPVPSFEPRASGGNS
ncbi:MAG: ABC transporter ATP-binding protein [Myxococcota bacterium]